MCGHLCVQRVLSGELAGRRFLLRPPEPSAGLLVSDPAHSVYVGRTKFLRIPFYYDPKILVNPHICAVGITGSGKSYFVKTFVTRALLSLGAGAVIIDWAGEYGDWVRAAGGTVISFGKEGVNLLELAGASPQARCQQVLQALEMLTDISSFPRQRSLTAEAIERAYASRGFLLELQGQSKKPPSLHGALSLLSRAGKKDPDAREAARRIKTLLASSGNAFVSSTISLGRLVSSDLVCIDLHPLPTESMRSLAGLAILQFIKEKMRASSHCGGKAPRLFVVVDEAWKIAADPRSDVVSIVREGRKYGFSLIVASQNPSDVHQSIFASAGTVLCFRLTSASERDFVRSSLSYSEFFERQSHSLAVGQAIVHLEFSSPSACPKTFVLGRVDGEELLLSYSLRGGIMDLSFEKSDLHRRLSSFGLTDRQALSLLSEFERRGNSLSAKEFIAAMARLGQSKAASVSLLRELGAMEKEILSAFFQGGGEAASVELCGKPPSQEKRAMRSRGGRKRGR